MPRLTAVIIAKPLMLSGMDDADVSLARFACTDLVVELEDSSPESHSYSIPKNHFANFSISLNVSDTLPVADSPLF